MEIKEITIKVKMNERWLKQFTSALKYMETLGNIGSSRIVALNVDGDGDFRPKFEFSEEIEVVEPITDNGGDRYYDAG